MRTALVTTGLRGIAWNRSHDALVACSRLWRAHGPDVAWDRHAPMGPEVPLSELARHYDLIAIDHPWIGQIDREDCLLPLNQPDRVRDLVRLAGQSVGASFTSYRLGGTQWALPITASAQVQAWRPDRLAGPVGSWDDLLALARHRRVLLPMRPPHSLLVFFTLAGNLGQPCGMTGEGELNDATFGADLLERLATLMAHVDPDCFTMDPADAYARMAQPAAAEHCAPYIDADARHARPGVAVAPLGFADIPDAGGRGPVGSTLGGAGIAVSAVRGQTEAALAFAYWLASGDVQRGPFADAGGQPASSAAWNDPAVDAAHGNVFSAVRETLEGAVVRPRHDGYVGFQHAAAERINAGLLDRERGATVMADLNRMFAESFG